MKNVTGFFTAWCTGTKCFLLLWGLWGNDAIFCKRVANYAEAGKQI
jgi:hypothetical protein